jgi:tRNA(fMet)-specific endonuclease VapC
MIALDTDHISLLQHRGSPKAEAVRQRVLALSTDEVAVTAATLEEQARSWISLIGRYSDVRQQVAYYDRFVSMFRFFATWQVLPFDNLAAEEFRRLRSERVRIGTTDLKIAAITLVHGATLVSSSLRNFAKVPGLRVEDWLQP